MNNQLVKIVEESGLEKTQGQIILSNFKKFFDAMGELEMKAKQITVTDVTQVKEMSEARELRLTIKKIRTDSEIVRKELKEGYLRGGRAVDGVANMIKAATIPLEEELEKKEKFAENLEKERIEKINLDRALKLRAVLDTDEDLLLYNYKEMSDEVFANLITVLKSSFDAKLEAIKKAEQDRIAAELKEKENQEKIRLENIELKAEAEAREKEAEIERAKIKAEAEAKEKAFAKEREESEKKLKAEAEAREKIEKELATKELAEKQRIAAEEQKKKDEELAKLEAEKQLRLQPEKDKLSAYADSIKNLESPKELSIAGRTIVEEAEKDLLKISQKIKLQLKNL